jgi:ABC-type glycerol-3-phosphate transport system substrate-binding protein
MQLKPSFNEYMAALISKFTAENPTAEVEWVDVPWADMEQKILSAIASGTAPDIANLNPQFATKLAEKEALEICKPQFLAKSKLFISLVFGKPINWKALPLGYLGMCPRM